MNEQFFKNIQIVKTAISERKLVVFAGAGVSFGADIPSWGELIEQLKREIDIPRNESDYLRIAQLYYNERQQKEFIDKLRDVLKYKKARYTEIHQKIFDLNPEHILTTNFDDLFEQVIKSKAYPYSIIKKDSEFPYAKNTKLLVKVHGDLEEGNMVIKEDDYIEYHYSHPLIESFIKGIFATKVVLFVGYSFSDLNLKIILQTVRNILGNDFQNAYMLIVDEEFHPAQRQYLRMKGINTINYDDGKELLAKSRVAPTTSLSEKGNRLLQLLRFIEQYNDFDESISKVDPLSQMVKSLERFNIKVLPPKFLGNLNPYNKWNTFIHNYNNYILGSNNDQINSFFFEQIDRETLKLKDEFFKKNLINVSKRAEWDRKFEWVLTKMNNSGVLNWGKTVNKIELFDYPKDFSETFSLKLPYKHCDCLSCKFNEFDFKNFLRDIREQSITETSDLQNDMQIAYCNYKAGNITVSINQFEEIGNKAWQLEEYIVYFISQHNVKILQYLLGWNFEDRKKDSALAERMGKLDLDKLMFQVPKLDDDVYKLLKQIRDDEVLQRAERKISEVYDKIVDVYERYEKKIGREWGPYYPQQILDELIHTFSFYTGNYIVKDEFSEFKDIFERGIKALFVSYATNERYTGRFVDFDAWVISFTMLYVDDGLLEKTVNRLNIKVIQLREGEMDTLMRNLNNLFETFFTEDNFMGREVTLNNEIAKHSSNLMFQQRLRNVVHNSFLMYALIDIPQQYGKVLVRNFLNFLKVEKILVLPTESYFNKFLKAVIKHFSYDEILELLDTSASKEFILYRNHTFEIISKAILKYHSGKRIENLEIIQKIISSSIQPHKNIHQRGFIFLWKVWNDDGKKLISEVIKKDLEKHFYSVDYFIACNIGAIKPSDFYSQIIKDVERSIQKDFKLEGEWNIYSDFTLLNFIYMLYNQNLLNDEVPYTEFDSLPDYAKFYFRPFNFDYSKFDVSWLLPLKSKHIFERLKGIPEIKLTLENSLREKYNDELSEIYCRFYV